MVDEQRPLAGVRVVVTRAKSQASGLSERLVDLGAEVVTVATIAIAEPLDGGRGLRDAIEAIDHFSQVVVASPNGARVFATAVAGLDPQGLPPVACVGPSTAAELEHSALTVNVVPDRAVAEGLVDAIAMQVAADGRLLLVQAEVSRDVLEAGLTALGWQVTRVAGYRTIDADVTAADRARAAAADVITFTSSSTVERFVRLVGRDAVPPAIVSIGPVTSATARDLGLSVDAEADPHTIDGLVDALVALRTH